MFRPRVVFKVPNVVSRQVCQQSNQAYRQVPKVAPLVGFDAPSRKSTYPSDLVENYDERLNKRTAHSEFFHYTALLSGLNHYMSVS